MHRGHYFFMDLETSSFYFIDEVSRVMKIPFSGDAVLFSALFDGYITLPDGKQKTYEYYPFDCLYYRNKKLKEPYINLLDKEETFGALDSDIDDEEGEGNEFEEYNDLELLNINITQNFKNLIQNLSMEGYFM